MQRIGDTPLMQRLKAFQEKFPPLDESVYADDCRTCHGRRWLRRDLPVTDPNFGTGLPCPDCLGPQLRQERLDRLWRSLPEQFRDWTLDTYPGEAAVRDQLGACLDGDRWLYLHGPVGRGKSGLAVGLLKALMERGQTGQFVVVPEMLERIRQTYRSREAADTSERDVMEALYDADVLVLDDLGAERATDWTVERLFLVIGSRYDHLKRTVFTSNLSLQDLAEIRIRDGHTGEWRDPGYMRVCSRIKQLADVVNVAGANLRTAARAA